MSSGLLAPLFGAADVDAQLTDAARLQAMLDVERALAEAEALVEVIPASALPAIRAAGRADLYDHAALAAEAARAGNLAIPLVRHLTRRVAQTDAEAARWVHWGATSQDVIDTGLVLQLRAAVPLVVAHLRRGAAAAARHARQHIDTPMAGRTLLQQATPITFGLKAAGWLDALERVRRRLGTALDDALVLQFGGAAGTLAALGDQGLAVAEALSVELELALPAMAWHTHRDRLADLACSLGIAAGTLGKIARDVSLLAQTEVGEAHEPAADGRGGSSTMPHKRNPVGCGVALAAAYRAPGLVASMLAAMPQEHERALGGWHAEWETLPELVRLTGGAARAIADVVEGLETDTDRMGENIALTRGLITAESVAMALAEHVGKEEAHRLVETASRRAIAGSQPLAEVLGGDPLVATHLRREEIERLLDADQYLGSSRTFVERVLARWESGAADA